jgi:hypothetical protein
LVARVGITPDMPGSAQFNLCEPSALTLWVLAIMRLFGEEIAAAFIALCAD